MTYLVNRGVSKDQLLFAPRLEENLDFIYLALVLWSANEKSPPHPTIRHN